MVEELKEERGNKIMFNVPDNHVVVKPVYDNKLEGSSIIQAHDRDVKYIGDFHGIVAAVCPKNPYELNIGDKVRFRRHEGSDFVHDGVEYISLKLKWIEGRIDE